MLNLKTSLLIVCGLSAVALIFAFSLEYIGGIAPCRLCWWQRYVYAAVILVGSIGIVTKRMTLALSLILAIMLVGVAIAGYHAGIEAGMFALPEGCVAGNQAQSVDELRAQLLTAAPSCDQVSMAFLGLSLSAWNALYGLLIALALAILLARDWIRR